MREIVSPIYGLRSPFGPRFDTSASLYMDFTRGTLDPRVTFSRTSGATFADSTGRVTYAPNNLALWSEVFTDAAWGANGTATPTVTTDAGISPIGTQTADLLVGISSSSLAWRRQNFSSATAGQQYIFSAYVKAAPSSSATHIRLTTNNNLAWNTGGSTKVALTNDWQRVSVVHTHAGSTVLSFMIGNATVSGTVDADCAGNVLVWGAQLEAVTYQTTPGAYNATTAAAYYGPRFTYDPVSLQPQGLLIEEQRTNLAIQSNSLTNAAWTLTNATSASGTLAPDGTTTAIKLAETATTGTHTISPASSISVTASTSYTFSIYAKSSERTFVALYEGVVSRGKFFNLSNGTVGGNLVAAPNDATITNVGNGWYRCTISVTATSTTAVPVVYLSTDGTTFSYAGVAGSGVFLFGPQFELGAFATSYIPTAASSVARSADTASMTGTNFSSWYNQSAGTFILNGAIVGYPTSGAPYSLGVDDGTASNFIGIIGVSGGFTANSSGLASTLPLGNPVPATLNFSVSLGLAANDVAGCINGGTVQTRNVYTPPTNLSALRLGNITAAGGFASNLWVRSLTYYRTRLPNDTLQVLTQ